MLDHFWHINKVIIIIIIIIVIVIIIIVVVVVVVVVIITDTYTSEHMTSEHMKKTYNFYSAIVLQCSVTMIALQVSLQDKLHYVTTPKLPKPIHVPLNHAPCQYTCLPSKHC